MSFIIQFDIEVAMTWEGSIHYRHLAEGDSEESMHEFMERHPCINAAEVIARSILPYTVVNNPNYTPHDINHSFRVCDHINKIIDLMPDSRLNDVELELLYQAALLHDIGMVFIPRDMEKGLGHTHGELSAIMLKGFSEQYDANEGFSKLGSRGRMEALCTIVKSHCMRIKCNDESMCFDSIDDEVTLESVSVRLKSLCAILSLADGLEIGFKRYDAVIDRIFTNRKLLVDVSDLVGARFVPYFGDVSRMHWKMEAETRVELIPERRSIVIAVKTDDSYKDRLKLKEYLDHYIEVLGLGVSVEVVMGAY